MQKAGIKGALDFLRSAFNLTYGLKQTSAHPLLAQIQSMLDEETKARAEEKR